MGLFGFGKPKKDDEHRSLLTTVHDNVELSIVQSILEGENIPYAYSERGSGGRDPLSFGNGNDGSRARLFAL